METTNIDSTGTNMASNFVQSFDACIDLCASLNFWSGSRACVVAVFMRGGGYPTNCWVQNVTTTGNEDKKKPNSGTDSGFLI